jgi:homoserine/homoserine lactone efflux protein
MKLEVWLAFVMVFSLVSISPGPGAVSSMSNTLSYGFGRGFINVLGLQCALLMHLILVMLGLGALFASSEVAFSLLKYVGAAYLVYLGIKKWRDETGFKFTNSEFSQLPAKTLFFRGFSVNITNPKSIIFFGALLPQFLDPNASQVFQFMILSISIVIIDSIVMGGYGLLASTLRNFFEDSKRMRVANRVFGSIYIMLGFTLATAKRTA